MRRDGTWTKIPMQDSCFKKMDKFFKQDTVTKETLEAIYQHLNKKQKGDVFGHPMLAVMKAFLRYKMTPREKAYAEKGARWGWIETEWTQHVMRAILYPKMTMDEAWIHVFGKQRMFEGEPYYPCNNDPYP